MSAVRRFRIASALARLIRKERGSSRVAEGFFPPQSGRISFVRVDGNQCHLVLLATDSAGAVTGEERTEVPRPHGDALLDVCAGKVAYDRSQIAIGGQEALIDRFTAPGPLELVSVVFESAAQAGAFPLPVWFGPEVTDEVAFETRSLALQGAPLAVETPLSNAALDAVLDIVENRFAFRYGAPAQPARPSAPPPPEEPATANALKRLSTHVGTPEAPGRAPAVPPPAPGPRPEAAAEEGTPDSRIDDVIESLSQALGGVVPPPEADPRPPGEPAAPSPFERWSVRPRRSQQS